MTKPSKAKRVRREHGWVAIRDDKAVSVSMQRHNVAFCFAGDPENLDVRPVVILIPVEGRKGR